LDCDL